MKTKCIINSSRIPCPCLVQIQKPAIERISKMKVAFVCALIVACVGVSVAFPQREGAQFTNEAIRQAQNTYLIPRDAQIQNVQEGIELGAYESIPGNQRINLFEILGDQVPSEVIKNLQSQVDQIGQN